MVTVRVTLQEVINAPAAVINDTTNKVNKNRFIKSHFCSIFCTDATDLTDTNDSFFQNTEFHGFSRNTLESVSFRVIPCSFNIHRNPFNPLDPYSFIPCFSV